MDKNLGGGKFRGKIREAGVALSTFRRNNIHIILQSPR
jgi:hypothetical protein